MSPHVLPPYVLITPARNEAEFIEGTIRSVVAQTVHPIQWVIVSDGSTDGTDEIVCRYAAEHSWIELLRLADRRERHFAGKVHAFNAGYSLVKDLPYRVIGSLDADVSFDEEYFAFLLRRLADDPGLGVVGTPFKEDSRPIYDYRYVSIEHVSGACQLFRRECFEAVGGYLPVKGGSVDHIAVITARMKGWKTRTFLEKVIMHHRAIGTAQHSALIAGFRAGAKDYNMGNHIVWELCRTAHQLKNRPWVIGGLMLLAGYLWSMIRRVERPVSPELVRFHRREQWERLKKFLLRKRALAQSSLEASCSR